MNRKAEKYLAALLSSKTRKEAAEKAGITPRWLREVMKDPEFAAEYRRRKAEIVDDATRRLQGSYQKAITALEDVLEDITAKPGERISAARSILEYGQTFTETNDFAAQLERLERMADRE